MNENARNGTINDGSAAERAEENRKTRSIRFSESEWEEVGNAARAHDMPASEFVREKILALVRGSESAEATAVSPPLAPLIERMFRYTWFLATEKRDEMIRDGREEEVDALVAEARAFHKSLVGNASD